MVIVKDKIDNLDKKFDDKFDKLFALLASSQKI